MKKKNIILLVALGIVIAGIIWFTTRDKGSNSGNYLVEVKSGNFDINVVTTGELEAKNSEKIMGPAKARNFRVWDLTIQDMVPDGTLVDSGEWIANLNRSEISNTIKELEDNYETSVTNYTKTALDTAITLRALRDEIINQKFAVEEAKILLDQSIYEPPATIRQYQISLEKAERTLAQSLDNYKIKLRTAEADMQAVATEKNKNARKLKEAREVMDQFTIYSPKSGMVVYHKDWDGSKIGIGSSINAWEPIVAELPDLSKMISKTYVNEVDVSKIKVGQPVTISIEAFPNKEYTGIVESVANIGEQISGSNAKVYEVIINVNEYDSILRPAMTTVNNINTERIAESLFVPIEGVFFESGTSFVYTSHGTKQEVRVGKSNDNEIIITEGLSKGDKIYLVPPENADKISITTL